MLSIPALIGPTAVGKTVIGLALAERVGGEIISADSRQVYRHLTIGTAKPTPDELARVSHHFINELELSDPFSAGRFASEASVRIRQILSRGRIPIVVGGSTLYIEALLHGLSEVPPTSEVTRSKLMSRLSSEGSEALYEELSRVDPRTAATMDPSKTQRLVRALEVFHDTGRPLSFYHKRRSKPAFRFRPIVLTRTRKRLYDRINQRVDRMLDIGLVEENRRVADMVHRQSINPLQTIGYREPMSYIRGEIVYEEMVRLLKRNSRRYAKRQLTWFRRREEYTWLNLDSVGSTSDIMATLEDKLLQ
jgi:tRNA dimethylallyltransferase